jgi:hypothetical protein
MGKCVVDDGKKMVIMTQNESDDDGWMKEESPTRGANGWIDDALRCRNLSGNPFPERTTNGKGEEG